MSTSTSRGPVTKATSSKTGIDEMMVPPKVHVSPAKSDFAMPQDKQNAQ
jgi:hypothetical protein